MSVRSVIQKVCLAVLLFVSIGQVQAGMLTLGSRSTFNSTGTIDFNSNFQDFGTGFGFPGNPFTRGDVTYNSFDNLTWGSSTPYTTTETLIGNNFWTPILGSVATDPKYDMFGFDIGTYGASPITIKIFTDSAVYVYPSLTIANSQIGDLEFRGFIATDGEFITNFEIIADFGPGNLPGITNVAVGHSNVVPEPASMVIWGIGVLGMGFVTRRRSKKTANV